MNRKRRWFCSSRVVGVAGTIALLLIALAVWQRTLSGDPHIRKIREQGYPASLAELNAWYGSVEPAENVALYYTNVFASALLSGTNATVDQFSSPENWLPARGQMLTGERQKEFVGILASNLAVLDLLHSAPTSHLSRYPVDLSLGRAADLWHLARARRAVGVLTAEAMVHCATGDKDKAIAAIMAAARLADSLQQEPLLASQSVRLRCWGTITASINRILNCTELDERGLALLEVTLARAEAPGSLGRCLAGERVCGLTIFSDRREQALLFAGSANQPTSVDRFRSALLFSALKTSGILQKDKRFYLEHMQAVIAAAEQPLPLRFDLSQNVFTRLSLGWSRFYVLSGMLLSGSGMSEIFTRDATSVAWVRATQAAVAVERFRARHAGSVPKKLDDLVPELLDRLPLDPFDGKPLRFKSLNDGYVVYSVGSDGKDDGGTEVAHKDIVFMVAARARAGR